VGQLKFKYMSITEFINYIEVWAALNDINEYVSLYNSPYSVLEFVNQMFLKKHFISEFERSKHPDFYSRIHYPSYDIKGLETVNDYQSVDGYRVIDAYRTNGNFKRNNAIPVTQTSLHARKYDRKHFEGIRTENPLQQLPSGVSILEKNPYISS
jgi:hypothetical protein